ncbi:MAG: ATPase [Bacteroidetes bacterium]|nr:MAG: ATPase [Bacteroidota bacterium]
MKISTRPNVLATMAIALLILMAAATILSLVIRHRQKNEINGALAILERNNLPLMKVEQTLGTLFNAEIEFREYTISYDKIHLKKYHEHINHLVTNIDTLQQIAITFNGDGSGKAIETLREREKQAVNYLRLKRLTDSLMVVALSFDSVSYTHMGDNFYLRKFKPSPGSLSIDTLDYSMISGKRKKGLLGKIKTFLVGEEEKTTSNTKVVVKSGTPEEEPQSEESDSAFSLKWFATNIIEKTNRHYQIQLKKQLEKRNELRNQELKLVKLNNNLINEIKAILNTFKQLSQETQAQYQIRSSRTIARSSTILQRTLLMIILISFPLAVFTIIMLRRNQIYQQRILESKQQALYQAEEKSRFLSYMSHEFRTPLASVIGFAEQIEQTPLNHDQKNYLSGLMSSSEMLLATVNDILDLSKLDAGKMSFLTNPFRPEEAIQQVMKSFKKMASDKSIGLTYKHEGKVLTLLGDEIRLKQVLNNLVSNAIKYTTKGNVDIVSRIIENRDNAELRVEVTDTGIGIDPEKIGKIFDEYSRVHPENPEKWIIGTGLGLAVTKKLVDQMGGQVTVASRKGKGSVFSIIIPYPVSKIQQIKLTPREKEISLPDCNIRILVADDNYFNVVLLQSIFKRDNVIIDVAENGVDALEKLNSGRYNILLSDMYMPEMDGLELTRQIRKNASEELKNLPVIMLTGNISPEAGEQMGTAGVSDFLIKPFQRRDLIEIVCKHLS